VPSLLPRSPPLRTLHSFPTRRSSDLAQLPQALVEELAFVDHQFAANDLVARGGVTFEIDAVHVILLLFVKAESQIDDFIGIVDFRLRLRGEINEAVFAVNLDRKSTRLNSSHVS